MSCHRKDSNLSLTRSSVKCITNYATMAYLLIWFIFLLFLSLFFFFLFFFTKKRGEGKQEYGGRANRTPLAVMQTQCNTTILYPLFIIYTICFICPLFYFSFLQFFLLFLFLFFFKKKKTREGQRRTKRNREKQENHRMYSQNK